MISLFGETVDPIIFREKFCISSFFVIGRYKFSGKGFSDLK